MQAAEFNAFIEEKLNDFRDILVKKGAEYVPEGAVEVSRFHNFEVSSALNGTTKEQALWGFVTKHIVSVADMVKDEPLDHSLAKWDEKIGDISVYMLLLHAMVYEAHGNADLVKEAMDAYQDHVASFNHLVEDPPGNDIPPADAGASFYPSALKTVQAIDEDEEEVNSGKARSQARQRYLDNKYAAERALAEQRGSEPTTKPVESDIQPNGEPKIGEPTETASQRGLRQYAANAEYATQAVADRRAREEAGWVNVRDQSPAETQKLMADAVQKEILKDNPEPFPQEEDGPTRKELLEMSTEEFAALKAANSPKVDLRHKSTRIEKVSELNPQDQLIKIDDTVVGVSRASYPDNKTVKVDNIVMDTVVDATNAHKAWMASVTPPIGGMQT